MNWLKDDGLAGPCDIAALAGNGRLADLCPQYREALLDRVCDSVLRETGAACARGWDDAPVGAGPS